MAGVEYVVVRSVDGTFNLDFTNKSWNWTSADESTDWNTWWRDASCTANQVAQWHNLKSTELRVKGSCLIWCVAITGNMWGRVLHKALHIWAFRFWLSLHKNYICDRSGLPPFGTLLQPTSRADKLCWVVIIYNDFILAPLLHPPQSCGNDFPKHMQVRHTCLKLFNNLHRLWKKISIPEFFIIWSLPTFHPLSCCSPLNSP